jgi:hypothetical protein
LSATYFHRIKISFTQIKKNRFSIFISYLKSSYAVSFYQLILKQALKFHY